MNAREFSHAAAARRYRAQRWAKVNACIGFAAFGVAAAVFVGLLLTIAHPL